VLGFKQTIAESQARSICHKQINERTFASSDEDERIVTEVTELPTAWVLYYQSRKYVETGEFSHALAGNGPFVVSKLPGRFVAGGSAPPISKRIQEALDELSRLDRTETQQAITADRGDERRSR
jgi:hypothetical protein